MIHVAKDLPYTKEYLISANKRIHWSTRHDTQGYWRGVAKLKFREAGRSLGMNKAHILVTFHHPDKRRRDVHNYVSLVVKPIVDGIVDSGLIPDDDDKHLVGPDVRAILGSSDPRITVEVTEID